MSDAARTALAVTVLAGDADARRLCVAWPLVERGIAGRALQIAWGRHAGVAASRVARLVPVLLGQGICRDDRTVDRAAQTVLQHLAAEQLRGSARGRPR